MPEIVLTDRVYHGLDTSLAFPTIRQIPQNCVCGIQHTAESSRTAHHVSEAQHCGLQALSFLLLKKGASALLLWLWLQVPLSQYICNFQATF